MEKNRPKGENHSMKHARKWLACLLAGALALAVLAGCSALMGGTVQKDTEQAKALMKEVDRNAYVVVAVLTFFHTLTVTFLL